MVNWQSLPHLFVSVKTLHGTGKSTRILLKMVGCGHFSRKCTKTFARAGSKTCRDRQGGSAFLEMLRSTRLCARACFPWGYAHTLPGCQPTKHAKRREKISESEPPKP